MREVVNCGLRNADFGGRKGSSYEQSQFGAGEPAANNAAAATCWPAGGRRLQKTDPFRGRPEDRETRGPGDRGRDRLPIAWCLFRSRCSRLKMDKPLPPKDLRVSGPLRNVPFRSAPMHRDSETFRFVPFLSVPFHGIPGGSQAAAPDVGAATRRPRRRTGQPCPGRRPGRRWRRCRSRPELRRPERRPLARPSVDGRRPSRGSARPRQGRRCS